MRFEIVFFVVMFMVVILTGSLAIYSAIQSEKELTQCRNSGGVYLRTYSGFECVHFKDKK